MLSPGPMVLSRPGLQQGDISGSMVLLKPGSVLISMAPGTTKGRVDAQGLGHLPPGAMLLSCCCPRSTLQLWQKAI